MKIHRFFLESTIGDKDTVKITDQNMVHQMRDVLRLQTGDAVILLDGTGIECHGRINQIMKREIVVYKEKVEKASKKDLENKIEVHLFASVIKKDKFEWVLQKATEIGVTRITPFISTRTEKQKLNMDRADKIVREAAEQSERKDLPFIDEPIKLSVALKLAETTPVILDINAPLINVSQLRETKKICIFIGPEGGWDPRDRELFDRRKVQYASLGKNILRAETASVAVASVLLIG
ncbi:MAG: 16S rRNA (uracil(1498)-N(3))-methyltransferase [Candidatus Pacebacteria bacterium]|nr:16S rRNA (uracil(1498)-N(3))-methyltransferase [Candidatus Paceibacterota bacterium]